MKKVAVVVALLPAVFAGWGGVRFFEGRVETSAAGESVQAGEIRWPLFDNTLTLKGVTCEIPGLGRGMRQGTGEEAALPGLERRLPGKRYRPRDGGALLYGQGRSSRTGLTTRRLTARAWNRGAPNRLKLCSRVLRRSTASGHSSRESVNSHMAAL